MFFDAGATLLFPDPPVEKVYARVFAAEGCPVSADSLSDALERAWTTVREESLSDRYGGVRGEAGFWKSFLNRVRSHLDGGTVSDEAFGRLAAHFRSPASWRIFDDVLPTLDALSSKNVRLGIVSNWDSYLPQLLDGIGLAPRFGSIVVSAIEETGKPDSEIFRRACFRLGVSPEDALHVGDSLADDFEGARQAGLRALLLDRRDRHPEIVERIRTLAELPPRVDESKLAGSHFEP